MKADLSCLQCSLANFFSLADQFNIEEKRVREFLTFLSSLDYDVTPVQILKASHEKIKEFINNGDPFLEKKKLYNQKMLERYSYFSQEIKNSADPLKKAVILSIGGNIIDFLPKDNQNIDDKIENLLHRDLAIDDVSLLLEDLHNAASILYLTDNTGEIVLDKLLIETLIEHNVIDQHKITVATRGMPIINDATLEDAQEIGLTNIVNVINNGDNSPGTILATSSKEFQDYFYKADVVVAKGMGNFETLDEIKNKKLYCLFVSKCEYASKKLGVAMDDFICKKIG